MGFFLEMISTRKPGRDLVNGVEQNYSSSFENHQPPACCTWQTKQRPHKKWQTSSTTSREEVEVDSCPRGKNQLPLRLDWSCLMSVTPCEAVVWFARYNKQGVGDSQSFALAILFHSNHKVVSWFCWMKSFPEKIPSFGIIPKLLSEMDAFSDQNRMGF